jgi:hypothetical protein
VAPPGGPDLTVALAYVTQSTQTQAFDVPLVAGKDGMVRVWVAANGPATAPPLVRVRIYQGATLLRSLALDPPGPVVPAGIDESSLAGSWNAVVPGTLLQPGRSILVDVDSDRKILETDEDNNTWPTGGTPRPLDVVALPPLSIRVLAVRTADGRTGAASAALLDYFTGLAGRLWPVAALDQAYGGTFTSSATLLSDGTGWGTALSEVEAKRRADGFDGYYYGAVNPAYGSGVAGIGYVGGYGAIGWDKVTPGQPDWSSAGKVLAHEIGHNFGLSHAPGCGAGSPDAAYPYADATLGTFGLDVPRGELKAPTLHDVMAYCSDIWVSDYNYEKVLASLRARAGLLARPASPGPAEALLLWGRLEGGTPVLEPAFAVPVAPRPPAPGDQRLTGRDARGAIVFSVPFALTDVGCSGEPTDAAFAFTLPVAAADAARLGSLEWESLPGVVARRDLLRSASASSSAPRAEGLRDGGARVRWDAAQGEVVLLRDPASGSVLGFGRGGTVDLDGAPAEVELRLPAGGGPARVHRLATGR